MFYVLNLVICKHFHNHVIEVYIQYIFDFALQRLSSEILRKKIIYFSKRTKPEVDDQEVK